MQFCPSALVRPHLECCIQLWVSSTRQTWTCLNRSRVRVRWSWRSFPTQAILWFNDISVFNKGNANFRRNTQLMMSLGNCSFINTWLWQEGSMIFINGESVKKLGFFFILLLHWGKNPTLFCFFFYMSIGLCTTVYNLVKCCAKLFLTLRKRLLVLDIFIFLCLDVLDFVFWESINNFLKIFF